MKNYILVFYISILGFWVQAHNGYENIRAEKSYQPKLNQSRNSSDLTYNSTSVKSNSVFDNENFLIASARKETTSQISKASQFDEIALASAYLSSTLNANQLPSVAITSPLNGATPAINTPLTLIATASDADGTITSVVFYNGTTLIGTGLLSSGNAVNGVYSFTFTPVVVGPMNITANATDNSGGVTLSQVVNVTVTDFSAAYKITFVSQPCNIPSVCMPISTITAVSGVSGYDFTVQYDKAKVVPTGIITVSSDLISSIVPVGHLPEYVTDYITSVDAIAGRISVSIYFNLNAPVNASFNGSGNVCCIGFAKTTNFQPSDFSEFSFTEIIESYPTTSITKTGSPGNLNTYQQNQFFGSLKFWSDFSPIAFDPLNPGTYLSTGIFGCGTSAPEVQPDLSGNFIYNISNGTSIDIRRDIANTTNVQSVINAQDAYLTSLAAVKGTSLINWFPTNYQMIAMDVNRDGKVTAGDVTQIMLRSVGKIPEFSQADAPGKDWSFVAINEVANNLNYLISTTFPEDDGSGYSKYRVPPVAVCQAVPIFNVTTCPIIQNETYVGILLADVDYTYASISPDGVLKSSTTDTASEIIFDLSKTTFMGDYITIPVSLNCSEDVHSFDFNLAINDKAVTVHSVESKYDLNLNWNNNSSENMIYVASYSLSPIPKDNTASLLFSQKGFNDALSHSGISGVLALVNGKPAKIVLLESNAGITENFAGNSVLVYPNPASNELHIRLPIDSKVQIMDFNGKQIFSDRIVYAHQSQTLDISAFANGVYIAKISNNSFVKMIKVIVAK